MKKYFNIKLEIIIILFIGFLSVLWFKGDFFLKFDDSYFSLNPSYSLYRAFYIWDHVLSTGAVYSSVALIPIWVSMIFLEKIGLSLIIGQKILYYVLFTVSGLSMYYLSSLITDDRYKRVSAFFSAIFYMMNPFSLSIVWGGRQLLNQFSYAIFPLLLALFIKGLRKNKFSEQLRISLLASALSIIFAPGLGNIHIIIFFIILLFYDFFYVIFSSNKISTLIRTVKYTFLFTLIIVLASMWWILPYIHISFSTFERALFYEPTVLSLKGATPFADVINVIRLLGFPFIYYDFYKDPNYIWRDVFLTTPFLILSFLPIILAFASFLFKDKNKEAIFFSVLILVGIFLMKAYNSPFNEVNFFITTKVPLGSIFKAPYDKYGLMTILGFSFLIGLFVGKTFNFIKNLSKKSIFIVSNLNEKIEISNPVFHKRLSNLFALLFLIFLFLLIEVIYSYPFWNGDVIHPGGETLPSPRVKIPLYYFNASKWISPLDEEYKIIKTPFALLGSNAYIWDYGYAGSDPLDVYFFTGHPMLGQGGYGNYYSDKIEKLISTFFHSGGKLKNLGELLGLFNIKYVLVHFDWKTQIYPQIPTPEQYEKMLSFTDLNLDKEFGKLKFFSTKKILPLIYATTNAAYVNGYFDITTLYQLISSKRFYIDSKPLFIFSNDTNSNVIDLPLSPTFIFYNDSTDVNNLSFDFYTNKDLKYEFFSYNERFFNSTRILYSIDDIKDAYQPEENQTLYLSLIRDVYLKKGNHKIWINRSKDMIFSENFLNESLNKNDWIFFNDEWKIKNGWLVSGNSVDSYAILNKNLTDFILETKIRITNQLTEQNAYPGVIFYARDKDNSYGVLLRRAPDGTSTAIMLWEQVNGSWVLIDSTDLESVELNKIYDLKLIVSNNKIKIFFNNEQKIPLTGWGKSLSQDEKLGGMIGFRSRYTDVGFSNITITTSPLNQYLYLINTLPNNNSVNISFQKIDPTKYYVDVTNAEAPFFLVFSESYDDGWKAFLNGEQIKDDYHLKANGFGNAWYINKNGNLTITLEYAPQNLFYLGSEISIFSMIILISLITIKSDTEHKKLFKSHILLN